jgi:hypothetical protein
MPKNNGRTRKAWRKEAADFNAAFWAAQDAASPTGHANRVLEFSKPYVRTDRPAKVN